MPSQRLHRGCARRSNGRPADAARRGSFTSKKGALSQRNLTVKMSAQIQLYQFIVPTAVATSKILDVRSNLDELALQSEKEW